MADAALVALVLIGSTATVAAYQRSFYPPEAPGYSGLSPAAPFVCGEAPADPTTYDGEQVFRGLLKLVEANPNKGAPEYGMLALGTGDRRWADAFRGRLLDEAARGLFTGPANSVKWGQHEAALRAYYYARVRTTFPDLFSPADDGKVREWLAAANRRALTVEWVDWTYALALGGWPEGPYENQENGAGLLAVLEAGGLAPVDLTRLNQDYLARNRRGWAARFRNTDDAYSYQRDWLINALFQSLLTGERPDRNVRLSFEWLLLQGLPDGAPLRYNYPYPSTMAGTYYLGATLLGDPRYVWLAGRALEAAERQGEYLTAQPGVEQPIRLTGQSPRQGSCLLYGDSGLPNQVGPLAPDKLVLRDGWSADATYLLLNLRFTGWHRYKATGTLTLLYQAGSLVADEQTGKPFSWLPVGRAAFRDKRIPREYLSGLLVERTGMSAALHELTGLFGPWAQDPPHYARVEALNPGAALDSATVVLTGWHGWQQRRHVYLYHGGPVVVVDDVQGPAGARAVLSWYLPTGVVVRGGRILPRASGSPVEMVALPTGSARFGLDVQPEPGDGPGLRISYTTADGRLGAVTVFLPRDWVDAKVEVGPGERGSVLRIQKGERRFDLPLPGGA